MSNNNRELSQFASRITVDDTTSTVSIASSLNLTGGYPRFGIGEATPKNSLHILVDTASAQEFTETTNGGGIFLESNGSSTTGGYGAAINFTRLDGSSHRRKAAIVPKQFTGDGESVGLSFFTANRNYGTNSTVGEVLTLHSNGMVGLGTDDPQTQLDVYRATAGTIGRFYDTGSNGYALYNGGPIVGLSRISNGSVSLDGLLFQVGIDKSLSDSYNIDETVFCVANTGVGIGTDNPDSTLNIQSQNPSGSTAIKFTAPLNQPNKLQFHLVDGTLDAEIKNEEASLIFFTDGNTTPCERMRIQSDKIMASVDFKPDDDGTLDLGAIGARWANIYTSDIDLSNESKKDKGGNEVDGTWGSYNIQEGENDLFLINRRSGKKYKFNITEVS